MNRKKVYALFVNALILFLSFCILQEEALATGLESVAASFVPQSDSVVGKTRFVPGDYSPLTVRTSTEYPLADDIELGPYKNHYIVGLADAVLEDILPPDADDFEKITNIYEYLICNCYFSNPIGLDVWQFRGNPQEVPTSIEWYALSPLAFGQGSCEDFAAAMVLLCNRAGIPAQYLPGLTYSVEGELVDHAWAIVWLEGNWYHVDPQLEWNTTYNQILRYRFFLKNDEEFYPGHRWGENLLEYYRNAGISKTEEELQRVRDWTPPPCTGFVESREAKQVYILPRPDEQRILMEITQERLAYEEQYGPLPEVEIEHVPPRI